MSIAIIFDVSETDRRPDPDQGPHSKAFCGIITKTSYCFYGNLFSPLLTFLAVIFFTSQLANRTEIVAIFERWSKLQSSDVALLHQRHHFGRGLFFTSTTTWFQKANRDRMEFESEYIHTYHRTLNQGVHKQIKPGENDLFRQIQFKERRRLPLQP